MSNSTITVAHDLSYTPPIQEVKGVGKYVSILPTTANGWVQSGSRIQFNIRDSQSFVDIRRSYMRWYVQALAGNTAVSTGILSAGGIQTCIQSIDELIGGAPFETNYNWGQLTAVRNSVASSNRQTLLRTTEGTTISAGGVDAAGTAPVAILGSNFASPLPTNLIIDKLFPLALCQGGWNLTYNLASTTAAAGPISGTGVTGFQIQAELMLFMITPESEYMTEVFDHLRSGKELSMANTFIKSYRTNATATTQQSFQLNVGYVESATSITQVITGATGTDPYVTSSASAVVEKVNYLLDTTQYPINTFIYNTRNSVQNVADSLMMMISGFNSSDADLSGLTIQPYTYLSLANGVGDIRAGVRLESGVIQSNFYYNAANTPAITDIITTFLECQGTITISEAGVVTLRYR